MKRPFLLLVTCAIAYGAFADDVAPLTDGEVWNQGVTYYEAGDVTNALRVLKPLLYSKTHGARAAEVIAKIEYDQGNLESASAAAQIALRAAPNDARLNRNFTRAVDGLPQQRETKRINDVLKKAQGQNPGSLMLAATHEARQLLALAPGFATNRAERAITMADACAARAERLADTWLPVREMIAQSVTNEEQATTILLQIQQAQDKTKKAARELGDLDANAYTTLSDVEHDCTRFLKMTIQPPNAVTEDLIAQSNAWQDAEQINGRSWQQDALDFTRAFRANFPAWARAYEQQSKADTNQPPFTVETQAKISALATELEKLQIECVEKSLPPNQEKALDLLNEINELMPKNKNGGQQNNQQQNQQNKQDQKQDQPQQQNQEQQQNQQQEQEQQNEEPNEKEQDEQPPEEQKDEELEATLKKAQERNDEHEAEKKARGRRAPLPPNERDW